MTKWRAILVGAMASGALAAGAFIPAHADHVSSPIGTLHVEGSGPDDGKITADGASTNEEPVDGSASLSGDGVCTSDDGDNPTGQPVVACNEQIILNELG